MTRHEWFPKSSRKVDEMVAEQRTAITDRYQGDDILLAYEYRLAWQVIDSHREAMLEEEMATGVPGHDTPISQLASEEDAQQYGESKTEQQFREFVASLIYMSYEHEDDA